MHEPAPFFAAETPAPAGSHAVWLRAADGVRLRLAHFGTGTKGTVLCFPGRTEYVEKYGFVAAELAARGFGMVAIDWRGQGLADRLLDDTLLGHVGRFGDYQLDVAAMTDFARAAGLPRPWYLLAHSMGGCIGMQALAAGLPVAAVAFSAPMWGLHLSPAVKPVASVLARILEGLGMGKRLVPGTGHRPYILTAAPEDNSLTTDADTFRWFRAHIEAHPGLGLGGPTVRWVGEALAACRRVCDMAPPRLPAKVFLGELEGIVCTGAVRERVASWPGAELVPVPQARHEVLMEHADTRNHIIGEMARAFAAAS